MGGRHTVSIHFLFGVELNTSIYYIHLIFYLHNLYHTPCHLKKIKLGSRFVFLFLFVCSINYERSESFKLYMLLLLRKVSVEPLIITPCD